MKGRAKSHWKLGKKLGLPAVVFLCFSFFLVGFFASTFISQDVPEARTLPRSLKSADSGLGDFDLLVPGESGDKSFTSVPLQVLSWRPRILYFPNFATAEQCESVIQMAKPVLEPSKLALRPGETHENTKDVRTSSGTFINTSEDSMGVLDAIEEKIARVTMIPRKHGEDFNILRYEIGQKYNSHYDAFSPLEYGPQKSQRVASFLLYLSNVEEGGETMFPFESGKADANYDFIKCIGLKVKPRRGDGLLFYSLFTNGTIDPLCHLIIGDSESRGSPRPQPLYSTEPSASLHGSCPVIKGEKWVATKWIRDQVQSNH